MSRWRDLTNGLLEAVAEKVRTFLELADWHEGKAGDPPYPQEKGRNPKVGAALLRAAGEATRSLALAGVRLEALRLQEEMRARAASLAEESRRSAEEWKRTRSTTTG